MKIVILAHETDNHTKVIKWALQQTGYNVSCWPNLGWQTEKQASIYYGSEGASFTFGLESLVLGDTVWIRRPAPPETNPRICEADLKFAKRESKSFFDSILYLLELMPVRCINTFSTHNLINNKSVQLLLARKCGMNVPATLMSNAPDAIKFFLPKQRSICKAFLPHVWQKADTNKISVNYAFELKPENLPADEVLAFAPAIFQEMVVKKYDIRSVLMGNAVFSYVVSSPKGSLDWREDYDHGLRVEKIETPPAVEAAILAFAKQSGLVFGSLDFAVDTTGQWWFLEVNEQGQFLWLDQYNPQARMLQKFLAFITLSAGASRQEIEACQSSFPSFQDYMDSPALHDVPLEAPSNANVTVEQLDQLTPELQLQPTS